MTIVTNMSRIYFIIVIINMNLTSGNNNQSIMLNFNKNTIQYHIENIN